ncbi:MAG: prepilin-type N-terminal cleavage/methylation domain-containing protein [Gemmataceae bacterium]
MRHRHSNVRRGLTMIELLIVVAILVALMALVAAVSPRLGDRQRASRGASQLQTWLNIAKQRAIRSVAEGDPRPYGVRLIPPSGPATAQYVRECQYVETPAAFTGGTIMVPYDNDVLRLAAGRNEAPDRYKFVLLAGVELPTTGNAAVQPGDVLDLYEIFPNQPRRIVSVTFVRAGDYAKYNFAHYRVELDAEIGGTFQDEDQIAPISPMTRQSRKPTYTDHSSYNPPSATIPVTRYPTTPPPVTAAYRIYRQARPVPGEPLLLFPKDVGIDISREAVLNPNWYRMYPRMANTGGGVPFDIMFDPSGRAVASLVFDASSRWVAPGPSLGTSRVCLWVRELTKDYADGSTLPEGDNTLITVYTRTGLVASHPVATTRQNSRQTLNLLDWRSGTWDPFYFTQDSQSSGQ